jgi:hypothetical protein
MDNAERSYHRALKQLLQLQSGYPDPAQAKAPTVELPPVEPVPAELELPPNQSPSPGIGFVPASRVCSSPSTVHVSLPYSVTHASACRREPTIRTAS